MSEFKTVLSDGDLISGSFHRFLPDGCVCCREGAKMVLFVTGLCPRDCFYCPLSDDRKNRDVTFANERLILKGLDSDILKEAEAMNAKGTGITGGDPILKIQRTCGYISLLKNHFGQDHHIHLYTSLPADAGQIQMLADAGLDEIRFHPPYEMWDQLEGSVFEDAIQLAKNAGIIPGFEIPALCGAEHVADFAKKMDCFLNLNELEFSENNVAAMKDRGYSFIDNESNAVLGSLKIAKKICQKGGKINFCSSRYKDAVQLRLRLIRTAQKNARLFDEITSDGTVIYGKVQIRKSFLKEFITLLCDLEIPMDAYAVYDAEAGEDDGDFNEFDHFSRVEMAFGILEELCDIFVEDNISTFGDIQFWYLERYPFENGFVVESNRIF
ncbi:radical SAM protein [Methanolapillus ohkumae]|uniref:Radical SAM protein n=1 Tax=Methanolapillus ohkumae TaxID=3028298 RepID=A0AA96ZX74_9EURY|nr:hypothetical protein MsAm2_05130 [Methanosarcinaceae archaeon Am2]